jgi:hypothetical protein
MSKTLLIVGAIVVIIILYLWFASRPSKKETFDTRLDMGEEEINEEINPEEYAPEEQEETIDTVNSNISDDDEFVIDDLDNEEENETARRIRDKFITRDTVRDGKYRMVDYRSGVRGNKGINRDLENYIDDSNELIQDNYLAPADYTGYNEATTGDLAPYKNEKKKNDKYRLKEIFNSTEYLPKHLRKDWFEIIPEAINVKNRHLINVAKPIGINTIGTSLRNPSWDIRGTMPCPKFVISPWMQSTIEPDTNLKSLC